MNRGSGRFASRAAGLRCFDAVVHAIADQMNQRIVELIDYGLVQLRLGALDGQLDILAQIAR